MCCNLFICMTASYISLYFWAAMYDKRHFFIFSLTNLTYFIYPCNTYKYVFFVLFYRYLYVFELFFKGVLIVVIFKKKGYLDFARHLDSARCDVVVLWVKQRNVKDSLFYIHFFDCVFCYKTLMSL